MLYNIDHRRILNNVLKHLHYKFDTMEALHSLFPAEYYLQILFLRPLNPNQVKQLHLNTEVEKIKLLAKAHQTEETYFGDDFLT